MKKLHSGSSDVARTETIAYDWKFEEADDHEHPFILTITIDGQTHSEGYEHDIGVAEAAAKADAMAREVVSASHG